MRDFLLQLITITAGVLIALSLEGLLGWNHYRTLVREARETIAREIADNKKEVDGALAGSDTRTRNLDTALRLANELLKTKASSVKRIELGFNLAELSSASWQSAERTGALAHMDYSEVQEYSKLCAAQNLYAEQQRRAMERMTAAIAIFADGSDPHNAAPADLELFRQQLLALRAEVVIEEQLGRRLSEIYKNALEN